MRAYLLTTGTVFGVIVVAHLLRIFADGWQLLRDPLWLVLTALSAALCVWGFRLLRAGAQR